MSLDRWVDRAYLVMPGVIVGGVVVIGLGALWSLPGWMIAGGCLVAFGSLYKSLLGPPGE